METVHFLILSHIFNPLTSLDLILSQDKKQECKSVIPEIELDFLRKTYEPKSKYEREKALEKKVAWI